jgi:endo-1,3(4)-beta-glucanase
MLFIEDHHFHYGYFLYASAIMAKLDPTFIDRFGGHVDALFHDIAHHSNGNSRQSEFNGIFFPMSRHKSWFDGHSFATGLFAAGNGKSQESSSEAINCYYGAYLWSLIRHDEIASDVTDFSHLLLSTEIRSAKMYWHMLPPSATGKNNSLHQHIYPPEFEENYMVGNVGMLDATANTWFGNDPLYVHMINCIPITAISNILFEEDYVKYEYPFLMNSRSSVEMAWRGYTVSVHSIIDPNKAWEDASALVSNMLDSALSKSQVLYFISQQPGFNVTLDSDTTHQLNNGSNRTEFFSQSTSSSSCKSNPGCVELNLTGECCPTLKGISLGCCSK